MLRKLFLSLLFAAGSLSLYAARPGFTLWQLPPQGPSQMNSYVIRTDAGRVVVIDGGTAADAPYLRGFLAALGNRVERWFVTHPHVDH
ncbi:MAG: MBL fold metallo-hydrolase, partial [Alistipes sp.]|nr:MBL fold metallo-hydrolase [Alistipes sp.]